MCSPFYMDFCVSCEIGIKISFLCCMDIWLTKHHVLKRYPFLTAHSVACLLLKGWIGVRMIMYRLSVTLSCETEILTPVLSLKRKFSFFLTVGGSVNCAFFQDPKSSCSRGWRGVKGHWTIWWPLWLCSVRCGECPLHRHPVQSMSLYLMVFIFCGSPSTPIH